MYRLLSNFVFVFVILKKLPKINAIRLLKKKRFEISQLTIGLRSELSTPFHWDALRFGVKNGNGQAIKLHRK